MIDPPETPEKRDFIRQMIRDDLASGRRTGVVTRFPPEPNGYLHIGHAKSICLNFDLATEFDGRCHLRFDDTNPLAESDEYVQAIQRDVRWLGYDWGPHRYFASDYFERLYAYAVLLIEKGLAYVDSLTEEEIRQFRGTVTEAGRPSPYRDRSLEENLDLFARMRAGEFADGEHVLRAKIDMAAANMKMRDPPLYRIRHAHHHRTGNDWSIYPLYDFTHCLSDHIEGITHSLCTLEFENNRELYDWILEALVEEPRPRQTEFARLKLSYTVMSKRKLKELVQAERVSGWDDPRMPTLAGMRRRGVTPEAIREFCDRVGVAKANSVVDVSLLEHALRDDLNLRAPRVMAVLDPLEVVIENYPADRTERLDAPYWPEDIPKTGSREVLFTRRVLVERDDFAENPPKGFFRLAPGREVRLRYAYMITCVGVEKDPDGRVVRVRCTYDPETRGGAAPDGRRVKGTLHWVPAEESIPAEVRLYDRLFKHEQPDADADIDFREHLNPASLVIRPSARVEPSLANAPLESRWQFERQGYFCVDPATSTPTRRTYNRIVPLKDAWARLSAPAHEPVRSSTRSPAKRPRPETPLSAEARRLANRYGIAPGPARALSESSVLEAFFHEAVGDGDRDGDRTAVAALVAEWVANDIARAARKCPLTELPFSATALASLARLVDTTGLRPSAARRVLRVMLDEGGAPDQIAAREGLLSPEEDRALIETVNEVLAAHPDEVARYRTGKSSLIGFFTGQVMKRTGGRADPRRARAALEARLERA